MRLEHYDIFITEHFLPFPKVSFQMECISFRNVLIIPPGRCIKHDLFIGRNAQLIADLSDILFRCVDQAVIARIAGFDQTFAVDPECTLKDFRTETVRRDHVIISCDIDIIRTVHIGCTHFAAVKSGIL